MTMKTLALAAALLIAAPAVAEVAIAPGDSATIRLSPQGELAYPVAPPLPHAPANQGAVLAIDIDAPGRYHVAIGRDGWIDLFRDGAALAPAGERAGAAGSGVAKIMDYDLAAGRYTLALSGMTPGETSVSITP